MIVFESLVLFTVGFNSTSLQNFRFLLKTQAQFYD